MRCLVQQPYLCGFIPKTLLEAFLLGCVFALLAQTGDFIESALKRRAAVKDSGRILPGHGGILRSH